MERSSGMGSRIGFVLVTYNNPDQLLRLIRRLITLYDNPPIVCHHDFSKSTLEGFDFPKEVIFVRPHIETKWGSILCVNAFLSALRTLYEQGNSPDWFVFLSGSDYPVKPAEEVLADLEGGGFDAYLDHRVVEYPYTPDPHGHYEPHGFRSAGWVPVAYDRYIAKRLWLPWYSWARRKPIKVPIGIVRSPTLVSPFNPFSETLKCYGGEWWLTGSRKAAERMLAKDAVNGKILAHFAKKFIPEEATLHTLLCNQPDLKISMETKRYIDWRLSGHHPKTLGMEDIPRIMASGAHFARKFDSENRIEVLDAVDALIDGEVVDRNSRRDFSD
jgi:hypothetical protein